jgi:hypothetical protein
MSLLTTLLLLVHTAFAAPEAEQKAGSARLFGTVRANVAVPTGYTGIAQSYSAEVGALFRSGNQLGLRFAYVPYAPNVYGPNTPDHAVGPVVVWAYNIRVSPRLDLYPAVGLGAVFGPSPVNNENKVLPYIQAGLGLRGRIPMSNGGAIAIGPEVGFVPTILAPYAAINLTMIGPKPSPISRDEW